jgi:hypothetical protein
MAPAQESGLRENCTSRSKYGLLLTQDHDIIASYLTSSLSLSPVAIISNLIVFGLVMGAVIVGLCYRRRQGLPN